MKPRFSLRMLFIAMALVGAATVVTLNWREWRREYLDYRAARAIQERAAVVFHDETKQDAPAELVQIFGSGELSHWGHVHDIGLVGGHIISCGLDRTVRVWSAETGEPLHVYNDVDAHVAADSSLLVTIDDKRQARVYDTASLPMKTLLSFSLPNDSKVVLSFASDVGDELAVAHESEPKAIVVYDMVTGEQLSKMEFSGDLERYCFGFREDGCMLAAGPGELRLMNSRDGRQITRMKLDWSSQEGLRGGVYSVARLESPWWLLTGHETWAWNEETHEWAKDKLYPSRGEYAAPGKDLCAWVANNGVMSSFRVHDGQLFSAPVPATPLRTVMAVAFERGAKNRGRRAIGYGPRTPMRDIGHVALLDEQGKLVLPANDIESIRGVAWSGASDLLAVSNTEGEIAIYSIGDWAEQKRFVAGEPAYMEFSSDGSKILTVCQPNVIVRDWQTGASVSQDIKVISGPAQRDATISSADGRLLAWFSNKHWELSDINTKTLCAASDPGVPAPARGWPEYWPQGPLWVESEGCYVYFARDEVCRLKMVADPKTRAMKLELAKSDYPTLGPALDSLPPDERAQWGRVLDFSPRDQRVLMCHKYKDPEALIVWDWRPPNVSVIPLDRKAAFRGAVLLPGQAKVAALFGGDLVVVSPDGKETYRQRIGPVQLREAIMEFSPDGRYLAIVNGNGTCYVLKSEKW